MRLLALLPKDPRIEKSLQFVVNKRPQRPFEQLLVSIVNRKQWSLDQIRAVLVKS